MNLFLDYVRVRVVDSRVLVGLVVLMAGGTHAPAADAAKEPATARLINFNIYLEPSDLDPFASSNTAAASKGVKEPVKVQRGKTVTLTIVGTPKPGYHTYPLTQRTSDPAMTTEHLTRIEYQETPGLKPLWPVTETEPELVVEEGVGVFLEHKKQFLLFQDLLVLPEATPGMKTLRFSIKLMVCDRSCVQGTHSFSQEIEVTAEPPAALTSELKKRLEDKPTPIRVMAVPANLVPASAKSDTGASSLVGFILSGIFWGAISLFTPCVFPMIPITVSFFLKQSEKTHHRPVSMALVYCLTIVAVLTLGAVLLLGFFQSASTNWAMNVLLGGVFIFFALSLFGMYDITLPSGLARFTTAHEGQGGMIGVVFMALTFSIISFSCVAPFMGGFAALVPSTGDVWGMLRSGGVVQLGQLLLKLVLGALAFSITFAAPFFLLALFPRLLRALPKSGSWMNTVKVVMGFLELAAALKFLRAAELLYSDNEANLLTYDLVLGMYVALALLCGLYLLNLFRLPHDEPNQHLGVPRLIFSICFLSLGLYLMPGLFKFGNGEKQRPTGSVFAWLDSFLLPDASDKWIGNLQTALDAAQANGRLVFIDFTGVVCTNCSYNENNVFPKPAIRELLKQYVLLRLYTDTVPQNYQPTTTADENKQLQHDRFKDVQLPLYAIVRPNGQGDFQIVSQYREGKINDVNGFAEFLRKPLTANGAESTAMAGRN